MKLLISAGYFPVLPNSSNNIAISVAGALNSLGNQCDIVGLTFENEAEVSTLEGVKIYKIPYACKKLMKAESIARRYFGPVDHISKTDNFFFAFDHPFAAYHLHHYETRDHDAQYLTDYVDEIVKLIDREKYDALICMVGSFDFVREIAFCDKITIPFIYYQVEPVGTSHFQCGSEIETIENEIEVMKKAAIVFTTPELLYEYSFIDAYQCIIDDIYSVGPPTYIMDPVVGLSAVGFDFEYKNILYCGTIDDELRNPLPTLDIMRQILEKDKTIKLFFVGKFNSKAGREYITEHHLEDRISVLGQITRLDALATMYETDMLLNIGNAYVNMTPSKIFTYFATGKPVINIQGVENCPARKYFDEYPLSFSGMADEIDVKQLLRFIRINAKREVPRHLLDDMYDEYAPIVTAKEFDERIREVLKGEKNQ